MCKVRQNDNYYDVIMNTMASQITSLTIVYSTFCSVADHRKHQFRVTGLCAGNSPGTAQMASNTENVSIWWCHQVYTWFAFIVVALCLGYAYHYVSSVTLSPQSLIGLGLIRLQMPFWRKKYLTIILIDCLFATSVFVTAIDWCQRETADLSMYLRISKSRHINDTCAAF